MSESIKKIENLPYKKMLKIMKNAHSDMVSEYEKYEMLPIEISNQIYYIPKPVWKLIERLAK